MDNDKIIEYIKNALETTKGEEHEEANPLYNGHLLGAKMESLLEILTIRNRPKPTERKE